MSTDATDAMISATARSYLRLHLAEDVGPVRFSRLMDSFGSIEELLAAPVSRLQQVNGIGPQVAKSIVRARSDDRADREVERAAACDVRIICREDTDYPPLLRHIADPPICLYVRGQLEPADGVAVAVVGTRRCSHYGQEQALRFGRALGAAGFTVVSGLARGIDGYAHRGALEANGRTIAVLGNGLGTVYPLEHELLAEQIVKNGAVVSELPIDAAPETGNFPRRNRIIVGLTLGVLVVEAGKNSGALITARLANEYNREAFAVPGRVDRPEHTAGVHRLIRDGEAKLAACLEDIMDELAEVGRIMRPESVAPADGGVNDDGREETPVAAPVPALTRVEESVLSALTDGAEDVDMIVEQTGATVSETLVALTSLQIKGVIRQRPGGIFVRRDG